MENESEQNEAAFVAGDMAFWAGAHYSRDNPYTDRDLRYQWSKGWLEAEKDNQRDAMRHSPEAQAMLDPGAQNGN